MSYIHWYSNEKPGWYEYSITRTQPNRDAWSNRYSSIVEWISTNIEMPHRHARWIIHPEHAVFRFRYERNYLLFLLRWS